MNLDSQAQQEEKNTQHKGVMNEIQSITDSTNERVLQTIFRNESIINRIVSTLALFTGQGTSCNPGKLVDDLGSARSIFQKQDQSITERKNK